MSGKSQPVEEGAGRGYLEAEKKRAVARFLETVARLRAILYSARAPIARGLASRPAAPRGLKRAYLPVFDHFQAEVVAVERDLAAAEDARAAAELRPGELRRQRDEAASELYELAVPLQRFLVTLPVLGVGDRAGVPTDPPALVQHAARTAALLRRLERDPLPPIRCGSLEAAAAAAEVEGGRWRLEALLEDIDAAGAAVGSGVRTRPALPTAPPPSRRRSPVRWRGWSAWARMPGSRPVKRPETEGLRRWLWYHPDE